MVQFSHPYMTTGKTIALTLWTFVNKVMSLLFNMLSRFVITFLRSNCFLSLYSFLSVSYFIVLSSKEQALLFTKVVASFDIPTSNVRVPVAPHSFKHLVLSDIFLLVCLVSKKWYTIGDLIYISLIYNDVEHVLICLLACMCTPTHAHTHAHTHTHTLLGRVQIICLFRGWLFFPLMICKDSFCILI